MVDPVTPNVGLAVPIRGSDVGTWDIPVNGDFTIIDSVFGGVTNIALTSAGATLTSSQGQNSVIRVTGTITANLTITLPSIYKGWTVDNQILNSASSFCLSMASTSIASIIGIPQGVTDVYYDGVTVKYRNLGKLGEYWDYADTGRPSWVAISTIPPYLLCNGASFSSAVYPQLANLLNGNTLPDLRGVSRATLNQGTARIPAGSGVNGDVIFSIGGAASNTLTTGNLPPYTPTGTVSGTATGNAGRLPVTDSGGITSAGVTGGSQGVFTSVVAVARENLNVTGTLSGVAQGGTSAGFTNMSPTTIGGVTMIKAI